MRSTRILVSGGTGFIGTALCDRLSASGFIVYVLTRKKPLPHHQAKITYLNTLNELSDTPIDIVINLAGESIAKRWTRTAKQMIYDSRILTTRALVDYMRQAQHKPTLFISASAIGYYGYDHPDQVFAEDTVVQKTTGFAQSICQDWEAEAKRAQDLGIRLILLRIGPVLGKNGGMLSKLLPSVQHGLGAQMGNGKQWISWIDRDDLISLFLFLIHHPNLEGPVNATAPYPVSNKEFSLALAKVLNKPLYLTIPDIIMRILFGDMATEIMLNGHRVLPNRITTEGFSFAYPRIEASLSKNVVND